MLNPKLAEGTHLNSFAFGPMVVRRLYKHPDTREIVADVKVIGGVDNGTVLHLSQEYINKRLRITP